MAEYHFVEDYERWVSRLIEMHPLDEAMSIAVGGLYERMGEIQRDILCYAGLHDGMTLVDLGCGSGRLAYMLGRSLHVDYIGIDIVQSLLDYARTKSPPHYRFILHRDLSVPLPDASADMLCAFSVFTHLLPEESYLYLEDSRRVLRPGGKLVFSFLEFADPAHWWVFENAVQGQRERNRIHLNAFIERSVISAWASHLGYEVEQYIDGSAAPWNGNALWQATAILRLPPPALEQMEPELERMESA